MSQLSASDLKVFIPSKDHTLSLTFYELLGWKKNWEYPGLAELELGGQRMLLQDFYSKDWAENFMIYIETNDATAWYDHVVRLLEEHDLGDARVSKPREEEYGSLVTYVHDPCGVLIHFAQAL